jgi:hypothetical protein
MGKKKKGGKKKGGKSAPSVPSATPEEFIKNYTMACKLYSSEPSDCVKKGLETEEGAVKPYLFIDEAVGPAGVRAATSAMLGAHPDMKGGKFTVFTSMNFVRCNAQADGAAAVAEVLRVGGPDMPNTNLLMCDCRIGERGCQALGAALGYGGNTTLKRLKLQYDETIGDRGASMLSRSLRMNGVLEVIHLEYCNIGAVGCRGVAKILEYGGTQVKELSLQGNPITGIGLNSIASALSKNLVLETLNLRDCGVGRDSDDLDGIEALKESLVVNQTLQALQFEENFIGDEGAEIFASMDDDSKKNLKQLWIEFEGVSAGLFAAACISKGGKGGKKGKKKQKK